MTPWLSFNLNWSFQLQSWHFGRQNTISCSRGHSLGDWLPWCLWIVKQGLGYLVWRTSWHLKVPWNLISAKRIPKHRVPTQIKGGTAAVGGFKFRRQWRYDSVSIWIEVSNCGVDILVARNFIQFGCHVGGLPFGREKIAFWTLLQRIFWQKTISCVRGHSPMWLVAVMSVDREARSWFGELSWHLKVPWNLISAKRFRIHTVPMQIAGGTAAVGVFLFRRQWRHDSVSIWIEISNCGIDILVAPNFLETIQFGCHMGGPLWKRKNCFLNAFTKTFLTKKTVVFVDIPYVIGCRTPLEEKELHFYKEFSQVFSWTFLRGWLPWCLWTVKQGLGLENCLDTLRFLQT